MQHSQGRLTLSASSPKGADTVLEQYDTLWNVSREGMTNIKFRYGRRGHLYEKYAFPYTVSYFLIVSIRKCIFLVRVRICYRNLMLPSREYLKPRWANQRMTLYGGKKLRPPFEV
jgi:hypothetical protein